MKFTKRYGVSQWVSEWVTDKHSQWSDSGPIKTLSTKIPIPFHDPPTVVAACQWWWWWCSGLRGTTLRIQLVSQAEVHHSAVIKNSRKADRTHQSSLTLFQLTEVAIFEGIALADYGWHAPHPPSEQRPPKGDQDHPHFTCIFLYLFVFVVCLC